MYKKLTILLLALLFLIFSGVACTKPETPAPQPEEDTAIFNFEENTQGWNKAADDDGKAVVGVSHDTTKAYKGTGSLKVDVHLIKGTQEKAGVEVYFSDPIDMTGKVLKMYMFIAPEIKGTNNGIQIFVKDSDWSYAAGQWISVSDTNVGKWVELTLDFNNPNWSWSGGGSNGTIEINQIKAIGVKIQMGGQTPAGEALEGYYWLDSVNF
ncbi:MAG: hypothetical protein ACK4SU_02055 [Dictyoglomus sp.]